MDHPMVREIEMTGYPTGYEERELFGSDVYGNEIYKGDEIFVCNDEYFLVEALVSETITALEIAGADRKIA